MVFEAHTWNVSDILGVCWLISSQHTLVTSPAGAGAKYCDEHFCVCLSVRDDISGTTRPIFTNFSVHVAYGPDLVLFRQGDKSQGKWAVWGFSSPLTMRCTAYYLGPTQKRQNRSRCRLGL